MTKSLLVGLLFILLTLFSGCVEELSTDTYRCDTGSMLYLHSDGTYHVDSVKYGVFHGNYTETEDCKLFLDVKLFGTSFKLMENGTNYVDMDKDNWIQIKPGSTDYNS